MSVQPIPISLVPTAFASRYAAAVGSLCGLMGEGLFKAAFQPFIECLFWINPERMRQLYPRRTFATVVNPPPCRLAAFNPLKNLLMCKETGQSQASRSGQQRVGANLTVATGEAGCAAPFPLPVQTPRLGTSTQVPKSGLPDLSHRGEGRSNLRTLIPGN